MILSLLGAPGAGKGTQAEVLTKLLKIPAISTGDIFRTAIINSTPIGKIAEQYINDGKLVPDDVVIGIVKERLDEEDCKNGCILDGVPRTISQADEMEKIGLPVDRAILIDVADEMIVRRLSGRRTCKKCGAVYHTLSKPPRMKFICDNCGGELTIRPDDRPDTILARLKVYHQETEPLKAYYAERGKLITIKDLDSIPEVTKAILAALEL